MSATDLISIRVTRHLPMGLGVETEDGQPGLIRLREIGLDPGTAVGWKQAYPVGWSGHAVALAERKGQIREFSLRLVERDPWEELPNIVKRSSVFEGIVTGIVTYGAFVEIAPGVTGLLHRSQLPAWVKASPIDLFWPGDRVYVTVQEIKYRERKVNLGFPESSRQIREDESDIEVLSSRSEFNQDVDFLLKQNSQKMHCVIVEDNLDQSLAIASWLKHLGQLADVFPNAEEALAFFEKTVPELVFADVGLPGMNGLDLARKIWENWPGVRVVITTDWGTAEKVMSQLEELQHNQAVELLIKPLLPEDLIGLLRRTEAKAAIAQIEPPSAGLDSFLQEPSSMFHASHSKTNILERLRRQLGVELAILFSIDKSHRQVTLLDCSGDVQLLNSGALSQLIYSPVRDVAEDQRTLVVSEIQPGTRDRFRYLLELYPNLSSFIGVPVRSSLPADMALFILDRHSHPIGPEQKILVESTALALAAHLEQEAFHERSLLIQRSALIGHLTRGMVHEINNLVGPLHSRLENLQVKLKPGGRKHGQVKPIELDNAALVEELIEIQNNVRKIINTTRMFGRIAAKGRNEVLRIDEIINETIHFMRDISDQSRVRITFEPPEHLLIIRNQAAALEQVILNVLLNAVQQIAEMHAETGGRVHVWIEPPFEKGGREVFQILFRDNGPGIHVGLWTRIFEAGYTTRHDGSGIGLYISWNLMEQMGGRIYVKTSHILSGSTFCLEIPYHL